MVDAVTPAQRLELLRRRSAHAQRDRGRRRRRYQPLRRAGHRLVGAARRPGHRVDQQRRPAARPVDRGPVLRDRWRADRWPWPSTSSSPAARSDLERDDDPHGSPAGCPTPSSVERTQGRRGSPAGSAERGVAALTDPTDYRELQAWSAAIPARSGRRWPTSSTSSSIAGPPRHWATRPCRARSGFRARPSTSATHLLRRGADDRLAVVRGRRGRPPRVARRSPGCGRRRPPWPPGCEELGVGAGGPGGGVPPELRRGSRRLRGRVPCSARPGRRPGSTSRPQAAADRLGQLAPPVLLDRRRVRVRGRAARPAVAR